MLLTNRVTSRDLIDYDKGMTGYLLYLTPFGDKLPTTTALSLGRAQY